MECNLELGLLPSSSSRSLSSSSSAASTFSSESNGENNNSRQEQMTIFYNGTICVCDVTDVQARSIISLASEKSSLAEEKMCRTSPTGGDADPKSSPRLQPQKVYVQNGSISMKRSLRQFLEKRKHRVQSASPNQRWC